MYRLLISELAHQDLDQIAKYIAEDLLNQRAALDFLDEVEICFNYIKDNPMIYARCNDKRLDAEGYRKAVIKKYIVVYKVSEIDTIVTVLRFFFGAQDYAKLI